MSVPIEKILPPDPILRRFSEIDVSFLELVDQIRLHKGSLQAPPVRPREGGYYQIVDGYRRLKASIQAGLTEIPVRIVELDDSEYMAAQMACNSQHADTNWMDYAIHLDRLRQSKDKEMTLAELAGVCNKSTAWVSKILNLTNLHESLKDKVRRGEIPVGNAQWLVRFPKFEQVKYAADAATEPVGRFERRMKRVFQAYKEALVGGDVVKLSTNHLRPVMRDLKAVENELNKPKFIPELLANKGITDPLEAALMALKWAFRMDDTSTKERQDKLVAAERRRIIDAQKRKQDRENLKNSDSTP